MNHKALARRDQTVTLHPVTAYRRKGVRVALREDQGIRQDCVDDFRFAPRHKDGERVAHPIQHACVLIGKGRRVVEEELGGRHDHSAVGVAQAEIQHLHVCAKRGCQVGSCSGIFTGVLGSRLPGGVSIRSAQHAVSSGKQLSLYPRQLTSRMSKRSDSVSGVYWLTMSSTKHWAQSEKARMWFSSEMTSC